MKVSVLGGGNEVGASCLHIKLAGTRNTEILMQLKTFCTSGCNKFKRKFSGAERAFAEGAGLPSSMKRETSLMYPIFGCSVLQCREVHLSVCKGNSMAEVTE